MHHEDPESHFPGDLGRSWGGLGALPSLILRTAPCLFLPLFYRRLSLVPSVSFNPSLTPASIFVHSLSGRRTSWDILSFQGPFTRSILL